MSFLFCQVYFAISTNFFFSNFFWCFCGTFLKKINPITPQTQSYAIFLILVRKSKKKRNFAQKSRENRFSAKMWKICISLQLYYICFKKNASITMGHPQSKKLWFFRFSVYQTPLRGYLVLQSHLPTYKSPYPTRYAQIPFHASQ